MRAVFKYVCGKATRLDFSCEEMSSLKLLFLLGVPKVIEVRGLVVSFQEDGRIKVRCPKKRWRQRLTTEKVLKEIDEGWTLPSHNGELPHATQ